jgi:lysozyme family protein
MSSFTTTIPRIDRRGGGWVDEPTIRAGEARQIIESARSQGLIGMSRVNKALTREQAAFILERSVAAYSDDAPINFMIAKNILREFRR